MDFTVSVLAEALTKLSIDDYSLAGYSLGGRVALHCALEDSTRISRLILEGVSPGIADDQERFARKDADDELARFIEVSSIEAFVNRWEQVPVLASQLGLPEKVRAGLRARRLACSKPGLAASLRGMGTGTQGWLGGRLGQIHVPTLLIAGAKDEKFTENAKFMEGRIPDSTRAIVDGAGHSVHLEAPQAYAEAILLFAANAQARNGTEQ
jgi:2-succinyl-6-hydroxy-2,4-cyclohexadiene-1-carboxylate synthase